MSRATRIWIMHMGAEIFFNFIGHDAIWIVKEFEAEIFMMGSKISKAFLWLLSSFRRKCLSCWTSCFPLHVSKAEGLCLTSTYSIWGTCSSFQCCNNWYCTILLCTMSKQDWVEFCGLRSALNFYRFVFEISKFPSL